MYEVAPLYAKQVLQALLQYPKFMNLGDVTANRSIGKIILFSPVDQCILTDYSHW